MNETIRPVFENSLKKAKDSHVVIGAIFMAAALGFYVLGIFVPAKSSNDKLSKIGMMLIATGFLAGGAYKLRFGRKLEQDIRESFANPDSVQGLKFVHVDHGSHVTYEIHLGVGRKKPIVFHVLNGPDAKTLQQFAVGHFKNAKSMS